MMASWLYYLMASHYLKIPPNPFKVYSAFLIASFSKDSTIKIGGLKGINSLATLLIDDTLDSRLESQKKWFEENSGLYISMR